MLADPNELSGLLNKAIAVHAKVQKHGLTESGSMKVAFQDFRRTTDPLAVWLERETVDEPTAITVKSRLLVAFNASCERAGRAGMTDNASGRALRRLRKNLAEVQRTVDGRPKQWCWVGIGLTSPAGDPSNVSDSHDSRDSRESSTFPLISASDPEQELEGSDQEEEKQNKENPVNAVKPVNSNDEDTIGEIEV